MKYYYAIDARRLIAGVLFNIYDLVAGTAVGVYATDKPEEIEALDKLAAVPDSSVRAIDKAEYDAAMEKKTLTHAWQPSISWSPPSVPMSTPLKGQGAVVVDEPADDIEPPVEIKQTVQSVQDALQVAQVQPTAAEKPVAPKPQVTKRKR